MDLLMSLVAKDAASDVFGKFSGHVLGAAKALGDMMKAGAEAERVERQLKSVAGDLTDAFKKQAGAISEQLAVEDELVMSMQTMLLRYGAAPAQIDEATRATLDYAAATGKDATAATEALVRGVQQGTGRIKALGIEYKATGDFTKDLELATAALSKKFAGAAETDAESVAGTARKAHIAMGELQESFGFLINDFIAKTGAVGTLTEAIKGLQYALFGEAEDQARQDKQTALAEQVSYTTGEISKYRREIERLKELGEDPVVEQLLLDAELKGLAALKARMGSTFGTGDLSGKKALAGHEGQVKQGKAGPSQEDKDLDFKIEMERTQKHFRDMNKAEDEFDLEQEVRDQKKREKELADRDEYYASIWEKDQKALEKEIETQDKMLEQALDAQRKVRDDFDREQQKSMDKTIDTLTQFGLQAGQTLMNGILSAMKGGEGGGADIGMVAADTSLQIIGAIFSAFGYGGLFSAFTGAIEGSQSSKTSFHTGGWAGANRYHSGGLMPGEVPAILQGGERVLSRSEVAANGGRDGVESMVRGGGRGVTVQVSAMDAQSVADYFGGRGGRALFNVLRSGRGPLPAVLGRP